MLVGGKTPILSANQLEELGFRLCVSPIETLAVAGWSLRQLARAMVEDGLVDGLAEQMLTFDEIKQSLGLAEWLGPERG
jgi:2-methylisocitrate lyase-like PEP mutase family enzyme